MYTRRCYTDTRKVTLCAMYYLNMNFESTRRRFMEITGAGATASIAGCSALQGGDGENSEMSTSAQTQSSPAPEGQSEAADIDTATVMVAVQPDRKELSKQRQEIRSEVESGNITQQKAQEKYREIEKELTTNVVDAFKQTAQSELDITIDDSLVEVGALLVSGPVSDLIDTLEVSDVDGLFPESRFNSIKSAIRSNGE